MFDAGSNVNPGEFVSQTLSPDKRHSQFLIFEYGYRVWKIEVVGRRDGRNELKERLPVLQSRCDFDAKFNEVRVVEVVELVLFGGVLELRVNSCLLYHN